MSSEPAWGDASAAFFQEQIAEAVAEGQRLQTEGASDARIDANLDRQRALLQERIRVELMQDRRAAEAERDALRAQLEAKPPRFCAQCGDATGGDHIVTELREQLDVWRREHDRACSYILAGGKRFGRLLTTARHLLAWQQARAMFRREELRAIVRTIQTHAQGLEGALTLRAATEVAGFRAENDLLRGELRLATERLAAGPDIRAENKRLRESLDALLNDLPLPERATIDLAETALRETGGAK